MSKKSQNIKQFNKSRLLDLADRAQADILDSKLSAIGESRQDIAPASGERSKAVVQRDIMQELRKCRAEHEKLRKNLEESLKIIESRNKMLSKALDTIQQNGLTIPSGAKKFKRSLKRKSMNNKRRKNMTKRRRRR